MNDGLNSFLSERIASVGCVSTQLTLINAIEDVSSVRFLNGAGGQEIMSNKRLQRFGPIGF